MIDYIASARSDSARFADLISSTPLDAAVPSCPDWTVSDLAWHLSEVQHSWASVVDGLLTEPQQIPDIERPADPELPAFFREVSTRMIDALARRHPDDECWSWHDAGHSVGWVRRRQAHEALIHRIDAELAAGTVTAVDPTLAADGVDEVLTVMLDAADLPDWATFAPDGSTAVISLADGSASWAIQLGRFTGTSPNTGNTYDDPALRLIDRAESPTAVLRGSPGDLNLWLWGRGPADPISVEGDPAMADRIRATAADGTQ